MSVPAFEDGFVIRLEQFDKIAKRLEFVRGFRESKKVVEDDDVPAVEIGLQVDKGDQRSVVQIDIDMDHLFLFPGDLSYIMR